MIESPRERRGRLRVEMTEAILAAAREVMRERGVAGLSLREVARRVRLQPASLYAYFPSKSALYDALFRLAVRSFEERKRDTIAKGGTFWERVSLLFTAYMQFAQENPELYQLAFERPVPGFRPSDESMKESGQVLAGVEELIAEASERGEISTGLSVTQARDLMIGLSHGLTSQHMANEPETVAGSGRFGSLIPPAISVLRAAWSPGHRRNSESIQT